MQLTDTATYGFTQARPLFPSTSSSRRQSSPKLTNRQTLEKRAQARNAMAQTEAKITTPYCVAVACDPYENTVSFRKRGQASVIHTVNLNTGECDCVLQECVTKINRELVAERSDVRCLVKCRVIVDLMEQADPECFANAPLAVDPFTEPFLLVPNATRCASASAEAL